MAKSKRWSLKDINMIESILKENAIIGKTEVEGLEAAAKYFGVTLNAVRIRWNRWIKGEQSKNLKNNTTKIPMKRKKRKYTKRKGAIKFKEDKSPVAAALAKRIVAESNRLVFPIGLMTAHVPKIKEIIVDFDARSITYTY